MCCLSPMVQQLTREGNILSRSLKADPMGDMQMTRWMQDRTLVTYWAKMLTFVGGIRFLWQSTLWLYKRAHTWRRPGADEGSTKRAKCIRRPSYGRRNRNDGYKTEGYCYKIVRLVWVGDLGPSRTARTISASVRREDTSLAGWQTHAQPERVGNSC